jgi:hypothetical protein
MTDKNTTADAEKGKNKQQRPDMDEKVATLKQY